VSLSTKYSLREALLPLERFYTLALLVANLPMNLPMTLVSIHITGKKEFVALVMAGEHADIGLMGGRGLLLLYSLSAVGEKRDTPPYRAPIAYE